MADTLLGKKKLRKIIRIGISYDHLMVLFEGDDNFYYMDPRVFLGKKISVKLVQKRVRKWAEK